jgi:hypothetical protein
MVTPGFFEGVLYQIGAPVTENNLSILNFWARHEGGKAAFNPLNTTKTAPNTTNYNSAGVKNYASQEDGIHATAVTLKLAYYPYILQAFKENKSLSYWYGNQGIIENLKIWGTVNLAAEFAGRTYQPKADEKKK